MVQMFMQDLKKVSALWSSCFRMSTLERFCCKGFLRNSSRTKFFVRLRKVSALEDVCFREVPLYCQPKQKQKREKNCTGMWIKHPRITSHIPYSELARTVFPVESTNNIMIKITYHRVIGNRCILEGIALPNAWWVSQSVL